MKALTAFLFLAASLLAATAGASAQDAQEAQDSTAKAGDKYWGTECIGPSRSAEALTCTATQSILVADTKQLVFQIKVIAPAGKGPPVMQLQGPLNVFLPGGFVLSVDGADFAKVAVSNCSKSGCFGAVRLEPAMVDALKRGGSLKVSFFSAPKKEQFVETPLAGFTRAIQAIE